MGRVSQKLIAEYHRQHGQLGLTPPPFEAERTSDEDPFDSLAGDASDPLHALYLSARNFSTLFAASVSVSGDFDESEFAPYRTAMVEAGAEYAPGASAEGPVTADYFALWSAFDFRFGEDRETIGSCLLDLMKAIEGERLMITILENLCESRMGVYEHCGAWEDRLQLRELITGDEFLGWSTSGYQGERGQLWYVRLCPPVPGYGDDHIVMTTPYVLTESSRNDWTAYLNKSLIGSTGGRREELASFLKYGNGGFFWHEFVFQAFHHSRGGAIFLAGLPDVPASLPRRRARRPSRTDAQSGGIGAASPPDQEVEDEASEMRTVKFSEPQRRAIASLRPELAGRLKLHEKQPRNIELTCRELDQIEVAADDAVPEARGAQLQPLKKILLAVRRAKRLAAAHCVYQLQMTWDGDDPPLWRRIQIRDCSLRDLQRYIQAAMGWETPKRYTYVIEGVPHIQDHPVVHPLLLYMDDHPRRLSEALSACHAPCQFSYGHGLGCSPMLSIELEFVPQPDADTRYPICVAGGVGRPPGRRGGESGYCDFLEAIIDSGREKQGEPPPTDRRGDADEFDAQAVTQAMRRQAE